MPIVYTCDICGAKDATEDYNGKILCEYHMTEHDLVFLKSRYLEKKKWVEKV